MQARRVVSGFSVLCVSLALLIFASAPEAGDRKPFGDALSEEHYGRDRTVDVLHYRLELTFDPSKSEVRGSTFITLSPLYDGLSVLELDAGPMEIDEVSLDLVEGSERLTFRHDEEKLRIELPPGYGADDTITIEVRHTARPSSGLYFVGPDEAYPDKEAQVWSQGEAEDNRYWFPSFDYPSDRATSEEIYTVPAEWTAVGNGELLEVTEDQAARTRTFHYRMDVPHVSYLVSVVAGRFEKYTDEFDGIPVEYLVPPGTGKATALRSFGPTPDILRFFSERTGVRYPYPKYVQSCAVDFIYGGMENIGATTQTAETLHDERAAMEIESWGLVAHEAAHQWFGDLLTCADWSHAWLNEGFATYWEKLWWEHSKGTDEFLYRMLQARESYLEEDRDDYRRAIVEHRYTDPFDLFDSHLYPKGAWVLHMIRGLLGDDAFFEAIAHYTRSHQGKVVETVDLRRSIAEATGVNLERFFDQWLRHGGHPEFKVTRDWDREERILTLHIEQVQQVDELTPLFALPLHVAVDTADGTVHHRLSVERAAHDLTLRLESEPVLVRFDPNFRVLCELDFERPVAEMLTALRQDPVVTGRIFAARDLAERAPREPATEGLAAALDRDRFYGVRIEAAKALGRVRGPAARSALSRALKDPDARVRTAAAEALGEFRDDSEAAGALKRVVASERAYGTYAAAVLSLARIGASEARETALRALGVDSHRERIRVAALGALAEIGGEEALDTVREWTTYGKPPRARTAAIEALAKLAAGKGPKRERTIRDLVALLDDPYIFARQEAMQALAALRAEEALDPLSRSARVETDSRLRREARRAIQDISESRASGKTIEELAAEIERLRGEVRGHSSRIEEIEKQAP